LTHTVAKIVIAADGQAKSAGVSDLTDSFERTKTYEEI